MQILEEDSISVCKIKSIKFLLLYLMMFCITCQKTTYPLKTPSKPPKIISINSLKVLNLSEDMSAISTKNDEVVLNVFLLEQQAEKLILNTTYFSPSLTFDQKGKSNLIQDTLHIEPTKSANLIIVFTLTELDEENSIEQVQQILQKELLTGIFLNKVDPIHLDTLLGFDDFLGMHYYEISKMKSGKSLELKFKGRQLFDKFDYRLFIDTF